MTHRPKAKSRDKKKGARANTRPSGRTKPISRNKAAHAHRAPAATKRHGHAKSAGKAKLASNKALTKVKALAKARAHAPVKTAGKERPRPDVKGLNTAKTPSPIKGQIQEIPRLKVSRAKAREAERALMERAAQKPEDAEVRRTRLKNLIKLGKERGYLTYAEINDHLPDVVDAEQIESMITTFNDMGIQVFDEAPDTESLLMSESTPTAAADGDVEEEAEAALSTVDAEFGRTTDPVRMYMREMGSVELLTREGEIEIAKRIEDGLKQMVLAIAALPTTIAEMLALAEKVKRDEMRIDELVDGLVDPNAKEEPLPEIAEEADVDDDEDEEDDGRRQCRAQRDHAQAQGRCARALRQAAAPLRELKLALAKHGHRSKEYLKLREQISNDLMAIRFTARIIERLCDTVRGMVDEVRRHERRIHESVRRKGRHATAALHQALPGERDLAALDSQRGGRWAAI